jgi:hypothetical protein
MLNPPLIVSYRTAEWIFFPTCGSPFVVLHCRFPVLLPPLMGSLEGLEERPVRKALQPVSSVEGESEKGWLRAVAPDKPAFPKAHAGGAPRRAACPCEGIETTACTLN